MQTNIAPQHSRYEPFPWVRWVRTAQAVNAIAVTGLAAYVTSRLLPNFKILYTFFCVVWTVVWISLSIRLIPHLAPDSRPNVIAMVCEGFSCLWWLLATVLLIFYSSSFTFRYCDGFGDCVYATVNDIDNTYGWVQTVWGCAKAVAGLAAVEYVLFKVTFIAIRVKAYRQKKDRIKEHVSTQPGNEDGVPMNQQHFVAQASSFPQITQQSAVHAVAGTALQSYPQAPPTYYGDKIVHTGVQQVFVPGNEPQQIMYVTPTHSAWNSQQPLYRYTMQHGSGPVEAPTQVASSAPVSVYQHTAANQDPMRAVSIQARELHG